LIVTSSVFDTINQLFLKSAVNSLGNSPGFSVKAIVRFIISLVRTPRVWLSFLFSIFSFLIWLVVLSKADLNLVFSLGSMHYIFIAFASGLFLKEKVGLKRWVGTVLVFLGIVLVSIS